MPERVYGRNTKPRIRQTAPAAFHQIRFSLSLESSFFSIISMMPHVLAGAVTAQDSCDMRDRLLRYFATCGQEKPLSGSLKRGEKNA